MDVLDVLDARALHGQIQCYVKFLWSVDLDHFSRMRKAEVVKAASVDQGTVPYSYARPVEANASHLNAVSSGLGWGT